MTDKTKKTSFEAPLKRPADPGADDSWAFLVVPKQASDQLPRRGRTTVDGVLNGAPFRQTLEPDGQLSHWLKVSAELRHAAGVKVGDRVAIEITPVEEEPDPAVPEDLDDALQASSQAHAAWASITSVARLDWIHWITSAKQAKTRAKRIAEACDKLASGKRRVCCFDPSGFYSKAFTAPRPADQS